MSQTENELDIILDQIREEHRGIEAPLQLEERLAREARENAPSASSRWQWSWGFGFALAAIVLAVAWLSFHASSHQPQQIVARPTPAEQTPVAQATLAAQTVPRKRTDSSRSAHARSRRHPARRPVQAEDSSAAMAGFVPLPMSEGLPDPLQQTVVRTRILTSSLPQYGLDVPASMQPRLVSAEFLVGEDGLPRAIRFVR